MAANISHIESASFVDQRRRFLRKTICDAQAEFSRLESLPKIMETALLTAMGTLGIACGFNGMCQSETKGIKLVHRGMASSTATLIEEHFGHFHHEKLSSPTNAQYPLQTDVRILGTDEGLPGPLKDLDIRLVLEWRLGKEVNGAMGLGGKITHKVFMDEEIAFLYNLSDHMLMAMQSASEKAIIQTLENELAHTRQRATDSILRSEKYRKELEESLFRLSGFNDIFHELSGLKESRGVVDAFLLVMVGIFSAKNGWISHWDDAAGRPCTSTRSVTAEEEETRQPSMGKKQLDALFRSPQAAPLKAMQAVIVPTEQLHGLGPAVSKSGMAVLYKVDDAARGMLYLGRRLVETPYGKHESDLVLTFVHNYLVFLKNSKSFETIQKLHFEQEQKSIKLEKTIQALTASRRTIAALESAGERIKSALSKAMARTTRVSALDILLILAAGGVLGLVYNFASPAGISVLPQIWRHPPAAQIKVYDARAVMETRKAVIVDARPVEFYKQRHIAGAQNLPPALFDFVYMMRFSRLDPQLPVVVYGRTISRHYDEEIAFQLMQRGHQNVSVMTGEPNQWQAEGFTLSP